MTKNDFIKKAKKGTLKEEAKYLIIDFENSRLTVIQYNKRLEKFSFTVGTFKNSATIYNRSYSGWHDKSTYRSVNDFNSLVGFMLGIEHNIHATIICNN